jgi:hypothetical protein
MGYESNLKTVQKGPVAEFQRKNRAAQRASARFTGRLSAGQAFVRPFGSGLHFHLEPQPAGWMVVIRDGTRAEDISRLTPPFHGVPNPREVEGWHFRNADNTGPNEPGEKNVNAPGEEREFIFSPQVGHTIQGPGTTSAATKEEVEKVRSYGRGTLKILDYGLTNLKPGEQARFEWIRFEAELSWPQGADSGKKK